MGIRDSLSKLKKKLKHPLAGRKPKSGRIGTDASGDDSTGSPSRPGSHIVAGGSHDQKDTGATADRPQGSTDRFLQLDEPESVPARGSRTDEGDAVIDGGEVSQVDPHLYSGVEDGAGSGPSGEGDNVDGEKVERAHSSPLIPPIPHDGEPDGM